MSGFLRVELPTLAAFQLRLPFEWISVAMHELPLPVLAAIDLCHSQIERYGLLLAAHVCLRPLEANPVSDVIASSGVECFKRVLTAAGEAGRVPFISRPDLARTRGHIACRAEERSRKMLRNHTSQWFGIPAHILPTGSVALT